MITALLQYLDGYWLTKANPKLRLRPWGRLKQSNKEKKFN